MLHEVVEAVAAATPAAREVVPGLRVREDDERRVRVAVLRRPGLEDRARRLEVEVATDERDEVRPRLHVVDEAPERAVVEPSSGQPFIRRAVQALAEVTRSGRRVGRIVGVMVGARGVHVQAKPGSRKGGDTRSARWPPPIRLRNRSRDPSRRSPVIFGNVACSSSVSVRGGARDGGGVGGHEHQ